MGDIPSGGSYGAVVDTSIFRCSYFLMGLEIFQCSALLFIQDLRMFKQCVERRVREGNNKIVTCFPELRVRYSIPFAGSDHAERTRAPLFDVPGKEQEPGNGFVPGARGMFDF